MARHPAPGSRVTRLALLCLVWSLCVLVAGQGGVHKRFEYKFSFKPPYLAQKDGSVPFWSYDGNAIASAENVRVTPSLRSQKGRIWSKEMTNFDFWEVELTFRVTGRGRIGADGLAFWYTAAKGMEGPVYGSNDQWIGLGVFFDSFDNDNKHNNPYISAMSNDGTKIYDHQNDGVTQQLAGCLRDFRNKPFPVRAKIEYYKNTLTILIHNGMSNNDKDFELCVRSENVILPKNGYFGVSAATGGLADDHDVLKFVTHSLRSPDQALQPDSIDQEESKKFETEFQKFQQQDKAQKDAWVKEHPDAAKKLEEEDEWMDGIFEDDNIRELKQIFQGQSSMNEVMRDLHRKMDEIIGRQERALSVLTNIQNSGGRSSGGGGAPVQGGAMPAIDTIRRDEVNAVLSNQRELVSAARDIKNFVTDVHSKVSNIQQTQARGQGSVQPVGGSQQAGSGDLGYVQTVITEIRDSLNKVKMDMATQGYQGGRGSQGQQQPVVNCPTVNCVNTMVLVGCLAVQLVLIMAYLMFKDSKEQQAKKFY